MTITRFNSLRICFILVALISYCSWNNLKYCFWFSTCSNYLRFFWSPFLIVLSIHLHFLTWKSLKDLSETVKNTATQRLITASFPPSPSFYSQVTRAERSHLAKIEIILAVPYCSKCSKTFYEREYWNVGLMCKIIRNSDHYVIYEKRKP